MNQIHGLCTDLSCRILIMSFPSGIPLQYDAGIGKEFTNRFHPIILRKPSRRISSTSNNIIELAWRRTLIFSTLPLVECHMNQAPHFSHCRRRVPTHRLFHHSRFLATIMLFSCKLKWEKSTKLSPLYTTHGLYASLRLRRTA